jgi:hypothetical protein
MNRLILTLILFVVVFLCNPFTFNAFAQDNPSPENLPSLESLGSAVEDLKKILEKHKIDFKLDPTKTAEDCHNDMNDLQAETNCDFYIDLRAAVEYIGDNDFSDSFGRFELRSRWYIHEFGKSYSTVKENFAGDEERRSDFDLVGRFHVLLSGALTSRSTDKISGTGQSTSEKVVEGRLGLQFDFFDFYRKETEEEALSRLKAEQEKEKKSEKLKEEVKYEEKNTQPRTRIPIPTATLAFLGEGGFFDPTNDPNNQFTELSANHFLGLRLYYRGRSRFNGLSLDAGWGVSEFFDNQDPRIKVRTYIPFRVFKEEGSGSNFKVFGAIETDVGKGQDELKLIMGISLPIDQVAKGIGAIFTGGK